MLLPPPTSHCDPYWERADWLPPWYILERWCQQDERCRHAKHQALLTACERGLVKYRRSDGKTFDDPVHELASRGVLLIERDSFNGWVTTVEGKTPLTVPLSEQTPLPDWATPSLPGAQPSANTRPAWASEPVIPKATTPPWLNHPPADQKEAVESIPSAPAVSPPVSSVPSSAIIEAFQVKADDADNTRWWDQRMRDAKRYGLLDARIAKGQLQTPSHWQPDLIALWLVDKGHLSAKTVKRIVLHHFPDWAGTLDYLDD